MKSVTQQRIMITGATDGLGKAVALELARQGAELVLHGRSEERGEATMAELRRAVPGVRVSYVRGDLGSFSEVRALADEVTERFDRLDVLVNNAGIYLDERQESEDGNELVFQVNYLSHVLLTERLLPLLTAAAPARIVNVSSAGQAAIEFDDIPLEHSYTGSTSYQRSKLAQIMFTIDLAERLQGEEVTVTALHPATYMPTKMVVGRFPPTTKVEDGAAATVRLAVSPEVEGVTGCYFNMQREQRAHPQAYDQTARRQLSALTERLIAS